MAIIDCMALTSNCCLSSSIKADCSLVWACKKLLTVKPYQEIFVIDISNQAHISRRTFYRNFKSKDDVINQYVISLLRKYTDWILQVNPQTYKEVIDDFFTYWPAHSAKLALLVKAGLSYIRSWIMLTKRRRFSFGVSISATPVLLDTSMSLMIPKLNIWPALPSVFSGILFAYG